MSASAGRIMILPKGNWDDKTSYQMLDLVNSNMQSYIAKKTSIGVEPGADTDEEYWQPMYFKDMATSQDVQDAFDYVFGSSETTDETAMSAEEVASALSVAWDGSSSTDAEAMSSDDVDTAVETEWDGSSSTDPEAMTSTDITNATT